MALIPAILMGIHAYKKEQERLAKQAEGGEGGGGKLNFGPSISFDEAGAIMDSFKSLGGNLLDQAASMKPPTINRPRMDFPTYKPGKSE